MNTLANVDEINRIKSAVELCNKRDVLQNEIEECNNLIYHNLPALEEYKKAYFSDNAPKGLFLFLSIALGFVLTFILAFVTGTGEVTVIIGMASMFVFYNVLFKKLYYKLKHTEFEEYAQLLNELEQEKLDLIENCQQKQNELAQLEAEMSDENVCIIPRMYWDNANWLITLINNKRATDLVSAINKFEDIMHQMRLESTAQESLEYAQYTAYVSEIAAENSRIAAENARSAAFNSGVSAVFSIANYLDN